jgi:sugar/nucleoside kinase (ribokinase family)
LIGADSDGEWIRQQCESHQIDSTQILTHSTAHTSYTDVMTVCSGGRRTFFHQRGANAFLDIENFDFTKNSSKIFHLGYLLLLDRLDLPDESYGTVAARLLHQALEAGFQTSIDVVSEDSERFSKIITPTLPYVDYCILNEFELGRTVGIEVRYQNVLDIEALKKAAALILTKGIRKWLVVHFPEGAYAFGKKGEAIFQSRVLIPASDILSSVGAGDAFASGFLYAMHEEQSVEQALFSGVCAAAASLYGTGSSNAMLPLQECLKLGEKFGFLAE